MHPTPTSPNPDEPTAPQPSDTHDHPTSPMVGAANELPTSPQVATTYDQSTWPQPPTAYAQSNWSQPAATNRYGWPQTWGHQYAQPAPGYHYPPPPPPPPAWYPPASPYPSAAPDRPLTQAEERQWAMLMHVSTFLAWLIPIVGIVAPIVIYLIFYKRSAFVRAHGVEMLNACITGAIVMTVMFVTVFGLILLLPYMVFAIVVEIIAAMRANSGEYYRYPLTFRFIKH
jgi:uncharacterized Tic20 family protein